MQETLHFISLSFFFGARWGIVYRKNINKFCEVSYHLLVKTAITKTIKLYPNFFSLVSRSFRSYMGFI